MWYPRPDGPRCRAALVAGGLALSAAAVCGQGRPPAAVPETVNLWPEGVPGAIAGAGPEVVEDGRVSNVHNPTLTVYLAPAATRTGTAVIICPGGAYRRLAIEKEGTAVAAWLNSIGVSAFVLKYRLKEYGHPAPLRDVLRAVRIVRARAARWQVDADRIGVMGFSAGGHLASLAGTLFDAPEGRTGAELDEVSARPDFLVLVYPVIMLGGPNAHSGSRESLLGADPAPVLIERLSTNSRVTRQTPPTFLVHGGTDTSVPPENSTAFYAALRAQGVAAEMHLYQEGPHGFGLEPNHGPVSEWYRRCAEWLAARGLLTPHRPVADSR
jgi:acetyl esterase/lipase